MKRIYRRRPLHTLYDIQPYDPFTVCTRGRKLVIAAEQFENVTRTNYQAGGDSRGPSGVRNLRRNLTEFDGGADGPPEFDGNLTEFDGI